jgi:hypothetical protein
MTLEQRVRKLEQENRWMRRIAALALAAVAAVVLMGQAESDELPELVARSVTIKDEAGNTRAFFGTSKEGSPTLSLWGKQGFGAWLSLTQIAFAGRGQQRAALGIKPSDERTARLLLCDTVGEPRISLDVTGERPRVDLNDGKGTRRVSLVIDRERPGMHLRDAGGKVRLSAELAAGGDGRLALRDGTKRVTWQVPAR